MSSVSAGYTPARSTIGFVAFWIQANTNSLSSRFISFQCPRVCPKLSSQTLVSPPQTHEYQYFERLQSLQLNASIPLDALVAPELTLSPLTLLAPAFDPAQHPEQALIISEKLHDKPIDPSNFPVSSQPKNRLSLWRHLCIATETISTIPICPKYPPRKMLMFHFQKIVQIYARGF